MVSTLGAAACDGGFMVLCKSFSPPWPDVHIPTARWLIGLNVPSYVFWCSCFCFFNWLKREWVNSKRKAAIFGCKSFELLILVIIFLVTIAAESEKLWYFINNLKNYYSHTKLKSEYSHNGQKSENKLWHISIWGISVVTCWGVICGCFASWCWWLGPPQHKLKMLDQFGIWEVDNDSWQKMPSLVGGNKMTFAHFTWQWL